MKMTTLREMTRDELVAKRNDLQDELFNLNMRKSIKPLDNPLRLRTIRREIGQIMTVLTEDAKGLRKLSSEKTSILSTTEKKK